MNYNLSSLDKSNFKWFENQDNVASLKQIKISLGQIRGLRRLDIEFQYPITAIAGKNGSGKTTLLALTACAYHETSDDFNPFERKQSYYTFSDFFIQSREEVPLEGIQIDYWILHNNWRPTKGRPKGKGLGWQRRRKKRGGKWNRYSGRVKRNVVFFGVDRVVPHSEKSVSKSYKRSFKKVTSEEGWEAKVCQIVGRILGQTYNDFWYKQHRKYRLPVVKTKSGTYSGFNMGAGENALFEIFSIIETAPNGTLFVIDEIELGLHEEAQIKLIEELKKACKKKQLQIICTTHSARVLECLPPEGRIFLEHFANETVAIPEIAPNFAMSKLSGKSNAELNIYVEDEVAEVLIRAAIPNQIRQRVNIIPFGSAAAVMRYMAGIYKDTGRSREFCVILDGDQAANKNTHIKTFTNALETPGNQENPEKWIKTRLSFLPGTGWPEQWVLSQNIDCFHKLTKEFGVNEAELESYLNNALQANKHSEFWTLAQKLNNKEELVRERFSKCAVESNQAEAKKIQDFIEKQLS